MTYELLWFQGIPLEKSIEFANRMYWNLSVIEGKDGWWYVNAGEKGILRASSRETIEVFLYGMGLAYSVLSDHIVEQFRDEMDFE